MINIVKLHSIACSVCYRVGQRIHIGISIEIVSYLAAIHQLPGHAGIAFRHFHGLIGVFDIPSVAILKPDQVAMLVKSVVGIGINGGGAPVMGDLLLFINACQLSLCIIVEEEWIAIREFQFLLILLLRHCLHS